MEIYVLNEQHERIGIIEGYESMLWREKFNEQGDLEIKLLADDYALTYLKPGNFLEINESSKTMYIERITIEDSAGDIPRYSVYATSIEGLLRTRVCYPMIDWPLNGESRTERLVEKLLNDNCGSRAEDERKIPGFEYREPTASWIKEKTTEAQILGDSLYQSIVDICAANKFGFKMEYDENNKIVFQLYEGVDHNADTSNNYVVFSKNYDNISTASYEDDITEARNVMLAGGDIGEGDSKHEIFEWAPSTGRLTGFKRREVYNKDTSTDTSAMSETSYRSLLVTEATKVLASEYPETKSFEVCVSEDQGYVYGRDYHLGDLVEADIGFGNRVSCRITEVQIDSERGWVRYYPTLEVQENLT